MDMALIEDVVNRMPESETRALVMAIVYEASDLFTKCGAKDDFCVHSHSSKCLLFGKINRIKWTAEGGWEAWGSHCTIDFLRRFHAMTGVED